MTETVFASDTTNKGTVTTSDLEGGFGGCGGDGLPMTSANFNKVIGWLSNIKWDGIPFVDLNNYTGKNLPATLLTGDFNNTDLIYVRRGNQIYKGTVKDFLESPLIIEQVISAISDASDGQIVSGRDYWVDIPQGAGPITGDESNYGADFHVLGGWIAPSDPAYIAGGPWIPDEISTAKSGKYQVTTRAHVRPKDAGDNITDIHFAYAFYNSDGSLNAVYPDELRRSNIALNEPNVFTFARVESVSVGAKVVPLIYAETANGGDIQVRYVRHAFARTLT